MVPKEKIAHDLTIIYLSNRYGVSLSGSFDLNNGTGSGKVATEHFPSTEEKKYKRVSTGEKGFLGFEKKLTVEDGFKTDDLFVKMLNEYYSAYEHFLYLLENN